MVIKIMNQELLRAFNAAFSRAKKSNIDHIVVPYKDNIFISSYHFSIKNDKTYYVVYNTGLIIKYVDGLVFNLGLLDNLQVENSI